MANKLSLESAIEKIIENTKVLETKTMLLKDIFQEVVAEDIKALNDQPPFPRSPLDGYAIRAIDSQFADNKHPKKLKVIGKVCAGEDKSFQLIKDSAVRIMTGAKIPEGADAIIMQEQTNYGEDEVLIYQELKPYQNYCFQGEDYKKDDILIKANTPLDYIAIGLLASNGISEVKVTKKPLIALISTGDELIEPGENLLAGKIYNSNLYLLRARLKELGIDCITIHVGDDILKMEKTIIEHLPLVDAFITTGGVSVGQKDIMNEVLPNLKANIIFEGVAIKPGTPAKFALVADKPLLALSGNPFAAAATFELLARPMLNKLMNSNKFDIIKNKAILLEDFDKFSKQRRFIRGYYKQGKVKISSNNSSGQLRSMLGCNCLVEIAENSKPLKQNTEVIVWML